MTVSEFKSYKITLMCRFVTKQRHKHLKNYFVCSQIVFCDQNRWKLKNQLILFFIFVDFFNFQTFETNARFERDWQAAALRIQKQSWTLGHFLCPEIFRYFRKWKKSLSQTNQWRLWILTKNLGWPISSSLLWVLSFHQL